MPGMRCCVAICNNSHIKTKHRGVKYYSFPSDPVTREKWIRCTSRKLPWNPDSCHVCSDHFSADDYERDLKSELLGLTAKPRLKPGAVPSLKLLSGVGFPKKSPSARAREARIKMRQELEEREKMISELLKEDQSSQTQSKRVIKEFSSENTAACECCPRLREQLQQNEKLINELRRKVHLLEKNLSNSSIIQKKVEEVLGGIFTTEQIEIITGKKKFVHWKENDIMHAFNLRHISLNAYKYMREALNYPLPGPSSLRRWASSKGNQLIWSQKGMKKLSDHPGVHIETVDENGMILESPDDNSVIVHENCTMESGDEGTLTIEATEAGVIIESVFENVATTESVDVLKMA